MVQRCPVSSSNVDGRLHMAPNKIIDHAPKSHTGRPPDSRQRFQRLVVLPVAHASNNTKKKKKRGGEREPRYNGK